MLLNAADKALWRLALPMIFSNITVPLLGLVDTAVIGHLDSPVYLGGVAVGATATSFLFMLLLFLRMSTTGLTAQAWGAKDPQRLARALVQPLALALGAGGLIILLRLPLIDLALHIVGGSEAVLEQARRFLEIRWLSAPASLANLVLLGWLLGVQYARAPVILLVVGNLLNIVLDLWLVMGLRMNVQGAALATVTAEYATLIIGLLMAKRVLTLRGVSLAMLKNAWRGDLRRLLALNRDIMLRSLLLQLCFGALTVFGARLGSDIVAAQTAGGKAAQFLCVPLESIGTAMTTYASQNMGAHDLNRVNRGVNTALGIGVVYSIVSFLILRVADKPLIGLFLESDQTEIMANAQSFIFWNSVFYIPLAVLIIYRYTIQGLGYSSLAMFAGVAEMVARALVGVLFVPLWGYFAACIASPVAWFFACFFLIPAYIVVYRRLKKEKLVPRVNL